MPTRGRSTIPLLIALGLTLPGCGPASPKNSAVTSTLPANLRCFGVEPFWSIDPAVPGPGTFTRAGEAPVALTLEAADHQPIAATWSIKGEDAQGLPMTITIARGNCSDGMSDLLHPYSAKVSYGPVGDRRGCCRLADRNAQ